MNSEHNLLRDLEAQARALFSKICDDPHTALSRQWMDKQAELFNFNLPVAERAAIQAALDVIAAEKQIASDIPRGLWPQMYELQARVDAVRKSMQQLA